MKGCQSIVSLKTLLIIGTIISLATAVCHNSCICQPGSNVCQSCSSPYGDSSMLPLFSYRYCPCQFGYYMSQLAPVFVCSPVPSSTNFDQCEMEIVGQTLQLPVNTDCYAELDGTTNYVMSDVNLDRSGIIKNGQCLSDFKATYFFKDPLLNGALSPLDSSIVLPGADATTATLKFLLNDVDRYSMEKGVNSSDPTQLWNVIYVVVQMGHQRSVIRSHEYELSVYTNRLGVLTFGINAQVTQSDGCASGQECIVIADLDTKQTVYTDSTYSVERTAGLPYAVHDVFYALIEFKDPTYLKSLTFVSLYEKISDHTILDLSSSTTSLPVPGGLRITLPLTFGSLSVATIQVTMLISTNRLRNLAVSPTTSINTQFTLQAIMPDSNNTNQVVSEEPENGITAILSTFQLKVILSLVLLSLIF